MILASVLGAAGFAAWAYSAAFTPPVDAQGARVFLFVPLYQGVGAAATGGLAGGPGRWSARADVGRAPETAWQGLFRS